MIVSTVTSSQRGLTGKDGVSFRLMTLCLVSFLALGLFALPRTRSIPPISDPALPDLSQLPLAFVPNQGQVDAQVRFQVQALGGSIFFTDNGLVLTLPTTRNSDSSQRNLRVVRLHFEGANPAVDLQAAAPLPGTITYLQGNQAAAWRTALPTYGELLYRQLYPGILMQYAGTTGSLKSTYVVAPGADPNRIRWSYAGTQSIALDPATGNLRISLFDSATATLVEHAPIAWQTINGLRQPITAAYRLHADGSIGFSLGAYNPLYPLTIDPTLEYSTFLNGATSIGTDIAYDVAFGPDDDAFIVGRTFSSDFPSDTDLGTVSRPDIFVMRLDVGGTWQPVHTTIIGGNGTDEGLSLAVDATGRAYVTGTTDSSDFPATPNALDVRGAGGPDAFALILSADGTTLPFASYLGGAGSESGKSITINSTATALYLTGSTTSVPAVGVAAATFPVTANAYQVINNGGYEAFVTIINQLATTPTLQYSTYLGGDVNEEGRDIAVDSADNAYVVGYSDSFRLPFPGGGTKNGGDSDVFAVKIDPSATGNASLVYSTLIGGNGNDEGFGLALGADLSVYLTGETISDNFPVSPNAWQTSKGNGIDGFVTHLSAAGDTLIYSTYLGDKNLDGGNDRGYDVATMETGSVVVVGSTASSSFASAPQSGSLQNYGGSDDAFVFHLSSDGQQRLYSTYLGGGGSDVGYGVAIGTNHRVGIVGSTNSSDYYSLPPAPINPGFITTGGGSRNGTDGFFATLINKVPIANPDFYSLPENSVLAPLATAGVLANDTDDDGYLMAALVISPTNGLLTLNSNGAFTYTPNTDFNGTDSFTYIASDGVSQSEPTLVSITITPVNNGPPRTQPDTATVLEDSLANVIAVLANDTVAPDMNEGMFITEVSSPTHGTAQIVSNGTQVEYTPVSNFNGNDSFTYIVCDTGSPQACAAPTTVTIIVTAIIHPPIAVEDSYSTKEDVSLLVGNADSLLNNDTNPEGIGTLTAVLVAGPANGLLTLNPNGTFRYDPYQDFNGTDSFRYVADNGVQSAPVLVTLTVAPINDGPPITQPDAFTVVKNSINTPLAVLANDSVAPDYNETLAIIAVTQGLHGTVAIGSGGSTLLYTPNTGYTGNDSFTYTVCDNGVPQQCSTAEDVTINITLSTGNNNPIANSDSVTTREDQPLNIPVATLLANDTDPEFDPLRITAVSPTSGQGGPVALSLGIVRYAPPFNFNGSDTFTYTLSDGNGGIAIGTVAVTVTAVQDPPIATNDTYSVAVGSGMATFNVLENDREVDGDPLTITSVTTTATVGTVVISGGITLLYTPTANFQGIDRLSYTISDGQGNSATAQVTITVGVGYRTYLPTIMRTIPLFPDLVGSFVVTPTNPIAGQPVQLQVTIQNVGNAPASGFWVDFYINPSQVPMVNKPWDELCTYGITWFVDSLGPGQSVTLNSTATGPGAYLINYTNWPGSFAAGTTNLYLYVDSWNRDNSGSVGDPNGAVIESNENNNSANQAISVTVAQRIAPPAAVKPVRRVPFR